VKLSLLAPKLSIMLSLTAAASGTLFADVVTGSFDIGGSTATVAQTTIVFNCTNGLPASCPAPAGTGNFVVDSGTNASGSAVNLSTYFGEGGYIGNLSEATTPLNVPFLDANWLTFSGGPIATPDFALDLRFIDLGIDSQAACTLPAAVGQTCTPIIPSLVGSPGDPTGLSSFNLQNTINGFTASFSVSGTARELATGGTSAFTGTFTAVVDGESYQTALAQILANTPPTFTYTASFNLTAIPEPGYLPMFAGFGILAIFAGVYRKFRLQRN
jgi:hypothetical protein